MIFPIHWHELATGVHVSPHPEPISLPTPSLWVVPEHQFWVPCFTRRHWSSILHMVICMFQCYSLKPSLSHLLPQLPQLSQTTTQLHSSHMLIKWCLKFSKPGFSNMWTVNFQMFKLVSEKAEEPEIKLPTSAGSQKKQESSRKTSIYALVTMPKPLTVWITINCGKFWRRWEYQTTWPASWETCMQVRKKLLELDMEQQTGSK